jgi:hypothetical protein
MVELIKRWTLGVFAVTFVLGTAMFYARTGSIHFKAVAALSTAVAVFVAIRFYFMLKPEVARLEEERRQQRIALFEEGCGEVAELMSYLSPGDFSVFITCHKMLDDGSDGHGFRTAKGSPVHNVLVAMVDVRCARPQEMRRVDPAMDFSIADYELTKLGKVLLPQFMKDAVHRRSRRESVSQP